MRTECAINADAQAILGRLEIALERERDGRAVVEADLAAAIEALRGLVGGTIDRHRVKFDRTAS